MLGVGQNYPHPPRVLNWRYIPSVAEMAALIHGSTVIDPVRAAELVRFMHSDEMRTFFYLDTSRKENHRLRSFMQLIRALNLKKVSVRYHGSGRIQMDKLARDQPFTGGEDHLWHHSVNTVPNIERDINRNALVGFLGPGTFPCHRVGCELCARTGRTATVRLGGPHGVLRLTKRATCAMANVVYVGVCSRCEELGGDDDWCVYFGETSQPMHVRCRKHMNDPCNTKSVFQKNQRFRTVVARRAEIERVISAGVDDNRILQDWYPHVCAGGIHAGFQRMPVVDVHTLKVARVNRETGLVLQHMMRDGSIDYRGMGRGCVNTYHDNRN